MRKGQGYKYKRRRTEHKITVGLPEKVVSNHSDTN